MYRGSGGKDITKYSRYFKFRIPKWHVASLMLLALGFMTGIIASFIAQYHSGPGHLLPLLDGGCAGILVISLPALLTGILIKSMRRKMKLMDILFATLPISFVYALFVIICSVAYFMGASQNAVEVILLLGNAGLYGYWFFINKVAIGQRRSAIVTATAQPLLNVLLLVSFGQYILAIGPAFESYTVLLKLYGGMAVFLIVSYVIIYVLDRPAKKELNISGVSLLSSIIGTSLYNLTWDSKILGNGGIRRDLEVDILSLKGRNGSKALFINPDIHYGPFYKVSGSAFPEYMGNLINRRYGAAPFIIHSAVNIDDNPMSTADVMKLSHDICRYVDGLNGHSYETGIGYVSKGRAGPCSATNIHINDVNMIALTKAPSITEDIDRDVGMGFKDLASRGGSKAIIVDAHNSRFETASKEELRGIYRGSKYIGQYNDAITQALKSGREKPLRFGSSSMKMSGALNYNKDVGSGYTSFGIFDFGSHKFGMLMIDSNNMLPKLRSGIIKHVRDKFGIDMEVCTTDTHAVNTLSISASNALGRVTTMKQMAPLLDGMIEEAMESVEPVKVAYASMKVKDFPVWGFGSRDLITDVGMKIVRRGKYTVPFLIVAAFVVAAWIIYKV
ncbi:MAG: DUF2070 family protein [Candidatus Micrarchaeota archaeon]|nr:DUF2070 family protein [Candidatus Micrarchaeota archaeon]